MKNRLRFLGQTCLLLVFVLCLPNLASAQICPDPDTIGTNFTVVMDPSFPLAVNEVNLSTNCQAPFQIPSISATSTSGAATVSGPVICDFGTSNGYNAMTITISEPDTVVFTYQVTVSQGGTSTMEDISIWVVFVDNVPPTFTSTAPADETLMCPADYTSGVTLTATDNCPSGNTNTQTISPINLNAANGTSSVDDCSSVNQVVTRTWTATDGSGNTSTMTQVVTVMANQPPVLNATLSDGSGTCDNGDITAWYNNNLSLINANVTDDCGTFTVTDDFAGQNNTICGEIEVTWTIEDNCGDTIQVQATFTKIDNPPVLSGVPADITINCEDAIPPAPQVNTDVTGSDDCDASVIVVLNEEIFTDPNCPNNSLIVREYEVEDDCGHMAKDTMLVTIEDNAAPSFLSTFTPPATNIVVDCDAPQDTVALGNIGLDDVEDNCSASSDITIVFSESTATIMDCPAERMFMRTWEVTDECSNTFTYTQTVVTQDTVLPTVVAPVDITIDCSVPLDTMMTGGTAMIADNCSSVADGTLMVMFEQQVPASGSPVLNIWRVSDGCSPMMVIDTQQVTVIDTIPPAFVDPGFPISTQCAAFADNAGLFMQWIDANGGAVATDNCPDPDDITWMALYADDGTTADSLSFINRLNAVGCPMMPDTVISVIVDFIATDESGNSDTTSHRFTIVDTQAPNLANCPSDQTVDTDMGVCEATVTLGVPIITDACEPTVVAQTSTVVTSFSGPNDQDIPVDTLLLNFTVDGPPNSVSDSVFLTILLEDADVDQSTEFFFIFGEDGSALGQTATDNSGQCVNTSTTVYISAAQYNAWAGDGTIAITLAPNLPTNGNAAVNNICGMSNNVTGTLLYNSIVPDDIMFEYSLNGGARIAQTPIAPFNLTFPQGTTGVTYYFTDCALNVDSCEFSITVVDNEAPVLVCPSDFSVPVPQDLCVAEVEIPLFTSVSDNCGVTTPTIIPANRNTDSLLTFAPNPNLGGEPNAENLVLTFNGVLGNAVAGTLELVVEVQGDFAAASENFSILDWAGNAVGSVGGTGMTATCTNADQIVFNLNAAAFNNQADSASIFFEAIANFSSGVLGSGIDSCSTLNAMGQDGSSYLTAFLRYQSISPDLTIDGITTTLTPPLVPQMITSAPDTIDVSYAVTDLAGNEGSCSFQIIVEDTQAPTAECVDPIFITISPAGFTQDTIFPSEIDNGSFDNCSIAMMQVSPNLITCDSIGEVINVTLTVTDESGNAGTCVTQIAVQAEDPIPTVANNCGSDTLFLFANPPVAPGGLNAYQYEWSGPQGFVSFDANPVVLQATEDNSGFYTVVITGVTGCTAQGVVQATVNDLPLTMPDISVDNTTICEGETITLTTDEVPGSGVMYNWYFGSPPNGFLLSTTADNSFNWTGSFAGSFNFYVETQRGSCLSPPSDVISVVVSDSPVAQINPTSATVCEGETLSFPIVNSNATTICTWTGPAGFMSNSCQPAPIQNISTAEGGFYNLIISQNGCESNPVTFTVNILDRPDTPELFSNTFPNDPLCEGEALILNATTIAGATSYEWESPTGNTSMTTGNALQITMATLLQHGGNWRVRAIGNPCISEWSEDHFVHISVRPESNSASVSPNPACEGETVTFNGSSGTPNVSFEWIYPDGMTTVAGATFDITPVNVNDAGIYTLIISNEFGCTTSETVTLTVDDRPEITGVANNAPNCVLGPVDVQLTATVFPIDDGTYTYLWVGPNFTSTTSVATVPQLTESGSYTLTITNGDGCVSETATTTVIIPPVVPTPAAPIATTPSPYCEDEMLVLTTTMGSGTNVTYIWETPQGTITTANNQLVIDELLTTNSGQYSVKIESDGCESASSGVTVITVNPKPVANPTSNSPVCEGEELQLSVDCMTGVIYEWQGPNGFSSSLCNPVIPNATMDLMDEPFRVRVNVNGCWSDEAQITVNVKAKPTQPVAGNFGPYCSSSEDVNVTVSSNSATPGATYTWFVEGTDVPLGQTSGLVFTIPNAEQFGNGTTNFVVVATLDGCDSDVSAATTVELNTIPTNTAEAGPPIVVCDGDIVNLQATAPSIGTGLWTLEQGNPTNVSIANPDQATTTAAGFVPGETYIFRWTLSNGVCENYASDTTSVFVNIVEFAEAGENIDLCNQTDINLNATMPTSNIGMWSQTPGQETLGVAIVDPTNPTTLVTGLIPGQTFFFTWTIEGGCGTDEETISVTVSNETAFAGSDFESCAIDGCVMMSAVDASGGGVWSTDNPDLDIISPNDPNTVVCGFTPGEHTLTWFINDGACGEASVDEVVVTYKLGPIANDDEIGIAFAQSTFLQLLPNDQVPDDFTISLLNDPIGGRIELDETTGIIEYTADINFIGEENILYELCAENCECSTATITIQVGLDAECTAPNIFTPNDDNINDVFVIPCLADEAQFRGNEINIFNNFGDEVFGASPYQNNWDGTFNGEDLPVGTYFYVLTLGNGERPMSGFITLQR